MFNTALALPHFGLKSNNKNSRLNKSLIISLSLTGSDWVMCPSLNQSQWPEKGDALIG